MSAEHADVVVIGGGVAGLSAALSAAETLEGTAGRVVLLEKATAPDAGGNTRWTDAYFRLEDVYEPADGFVEDMLEFSQGRTDRSYVERLVEKLPEAMEWVQGHGVRFQRRATYFVTASRPRMMPVGGGESLVRNLTEGCEKLQVEIRYGAAVDGIQPSDGEYRISFAGDAGEGELLTRTCVIACGGFEGNRERLRNHIGEAGERMKPIAPGGRFNTGEVIDLALELGVAPAGEWSNFHGEPIDARSTQPEASVMVFPYGILVNAEAARFIDEGAGTVDETYEDLARAILAQPESKAWLISDATFSEVPGVERGLLTDRAPIKAESVAELATELGLDPHALQSTVDEYNAAVAEGPYDPLRPDGKHTEGLNPPKSNWATVISRPPFVAYPLTTDIVFTYGGLATDEEAHAVDQEGHPVPGLFAAGECTGIYYHKYPGATSVMRGLVFGRVAGLGAAAEARRVRA
jgi:tricarballylate dehydrogenase